MDLTNEILETIAKVKQLNGGDFTETSDLDDAKEIAPQLFQLYGSIVEFSSLAGFQINEVDAGTYETLESDCDTILAQISALELQFSIQLGKAQARANFETNLVQLDKQQVEEIEQHIDNARKKIRDSAAFEDKHKARLLKRLEKLQAEINKKVSDLDVMLAGVTEVSAVVGESAKNLNPVVDLFQKIFQVADRQNSDQLQLPAPPKQIEDQRHPDE